MSISMWVDMDVIRFAAQFEGHQLEITQDDDGSTEFQILQRSQGSVRYGHDGIAFYRISTEPIDENDPLLDALNERDDNAV